KAAKAAKQEETASGDAGTDPEGTAAMADLGNLTDAQRAKLAALLDLPDEQLDALAAGGVVLTPDEVTAMVAPDAEDDGEDGAEDDGDDLVAQIEGMTDEQLAALEAEFNAETTEAEAPAYRPNTVPEGEPVAAGLTAEAQFAIDLANARQEETARELAVVTARLREEDYQAEKRRLADSGVPPYITELARPLLEGAGHAVELSNGKTVDAGAVMRRVLTEYARQARLLDLDVELGSPMDEPEGVAHEQADASREDLVSRFKNVTGLR
ncbi:MAG TPA: hypothetical protein VGH54_06165, partial [Mycobacterium sp.]|uniref:hypothetical protein n=1 Tax=Mycobacterium sp. TaxID=1785 RepID=UPI002F3FBDEF